MEIIEEIVGKIVILKVSGRLDIASFEDLEKKIDKLVASGQVQILLDFEGLFFISSAGLRTLIIALKKTTSAGGKLFISALSKDAKKIFEITGYDELFTTFENIEIALKHF